MGHAAPAHRPFIRTHLPTLQMGSLHKEQPSANDFLPIEMWEAIKEVPSFLTAFPMFAEFTGVLLLSNTL